MRQLFMRQRVFSIGDSCVIKDRSGNDVYEVAVPEGKNIKGMTVFDNDRNPVITIKRKSLNVFPKIVIEVGNQEVFVIEKRLNSDYRIISQGIAIYDDWRKMDFDVMAGYRKVAKVRKRWVYPGDSYELTIFEKENELALVGLLIAFEMIKKMDVAAEAV